jgi:hypothetical protein
MKKGIYETFYGNAAYVTGESAKNAYDLDSGERIPISQVNPKKFIRKAESADSDMARHASGW